MVMINECMDLSREYVPHRFKLVLPIRSKVTLMLPRSKESKALELLITRRLLKYTTSDVIP